LHHPKLFGALILSLLPAYNVYLIGAGIPSVDPVHLGFLAFFVFAIAIYAALTIREGARELRALRTACERIYPQPREAVPPLFPVNQARSLPRARAEFQGDAGEAQSAEAAGRAQHANDEGAGRLG